MWVLLAIGSMGSALGWFGNEALFDRLEQSAPSVPGESKTADDILSRRASGLTTLVRVDGADLTQADVQQAGAKLQATLAALPDVDKVASPFMVPGAQLTDAEKAFISPSKTTSLMFVVTMNPGLTMSQQRQVVAAAAADGTAAFQGTHAKVTSGGTRQLVDKVTDLIKVDLQRGEGFALPVSLIVMVLVFGGLVAATVPIIGALAAIAGALGVLLAFSHLTDLDATVVNIVTLMGLALSIDYGLLIVNRYREEIARMAPDLSHDTLDDEHLVEATGRTTATAGRTVLFSALIIAISISGLTLFKSQIIRAVGLAGLSIVLLALVAALTLVPAVCRIAGRRLVRRRMAAPADHGLFNTLARLVHRWRYVVAAACVAVLVALAWPTLSIRQTSSGAELLPKGAAERTFLESFATDFPQLATPTATVVAKADTAQLQQWAASLPRRITEVAKVTSLQDIGGGYATIGFTAPSASVHNTVGKDLADVLRAQDTSFDAWVTGNDARQLDFLDSVKSTAPWAILIIGLTTFVLLFLMTGSVVLPVKALIFNVLSIGAAFGAMTWIFQDAHLEHLLRFTSAGGIELVVPVIMLAFGFGLSMDYEVFLLSRILELHEQGASDGDAVQLGLQRSGRIITSAALLILIVLSGFVFAQILVVKEIGVGMFISVLLDATIVRMLLVPATMSMLGKWNWWAPGPLHRLHDRFGLKESGEFDDPEIESVTGPVPAPKRAAGGVRGLGRAEGAPRRAAD